MGYMKAQTVASGGDPSMDMSAMNQAVLEINPSHPIVQDLDGMIKGGNKDSAETENFAVLMYDVAAMTSGYDIQDTPDFAKRVMTLMTAKAQDSTASVEETV